jgi:hypothetical protein
LAKLRDEGSKELSTNRKGIVFFDPFDKAVTDLDLLVEISTIPRLCPDPRMRPHSVVTALLLGAALADSVVDDDRWARSLVTAAGLGLVHVGIFVWSRMWDGACCRRV